MSYWNKFYKKNHTRVPSNFARMFSGFIGKNDRVIELGCGNGRDALFLHYRVMDYCCLDYSEEAISLVKTYELSNVQTKQGDMSKVNLIDYTAVYSRFSLHSIDENKEKDLFRNLSKCRPGTLFAVEARSNKGAFEGDHYRRFINNERFKNSMDSMGFETLVHTEAVGLSVYKEEDPPVIWYIGIKK